jgi:hypothetical protein
LTLWSVLDAADMVRDVAPSLDAYWEVVVGSAMVTVMEVSR